MAVAKKNKRVGQTSKTDAGLEVAKKLDIKPITKVQEKKPIGKARFFLVDFTMSFKRADGTSGIISDTVALGKMYDFPNKIQFQNQIPSVYNITEENKFSDIVVYNVRPWHLPEIDYNAFIKGD